MNGTATALGIDAGGTHTDAVVCRDGRILGRAKVATRHDNLPASIEEVLAELMADAGEDAVRQASRITLGTTLVVNAEVQGQLDEVGLVLSAGPGLSPLRFAMGSRVHVVPGGLDHRGVEVEALNFDGLAGAASSWTAAGVQAFACVGKFSPRNPAHELAMARAVRQAVPDAKLTLGHQLSGELNFPRRIATAYYNAAASRLHNSFLDAVEGVLAKLGLDAPVFLLKADGGAVPLKASREQPVQSILSGPAASVMGVMALAPDLEAGSSLLCDIGGTTTDLAVFVDGSPVTDRGGMALGGRRTLVRALATLSIGVGGDSRVFVRGAGRSLEVETGPLRTGPAMAFGGSDPTLLDALNVLNVHGPDSQAGDAGASRRGLEALGAPAGLSAEALAAMAWESASGKIAKAVSSLLDGINAHPIYTLRELKGHRDVVCSRIHLVGGPAACLARRLEDAMGIPVAATACADVANAVGAALTRPTASLQVYADTGRGELSAPSLDYREPADRRTTLERVKARALELLAGRMAEQGMTDCPVEVAEADLFATLSDSGAGSKDIRVTCQAVPGIIQRIVA
ncbi:MAG: hydantoinase/oxoprolinase family protein [Desulfovibrio sp.]|nr:hydantoinase/oxoprolinase family protein [Desulfovibrio sp.]